MSAGLPASPVRLAVLISGGGTTLRNLLEKIADGELDARIELVISSNPQAGGLAIAAEAGVPTQVFERRDYTSDAAYGEAVFGACRAVAPHLVVMAGFLKFTPVPDDFTGRVLNIHPSLIPAFCGQGMYGLRVHQAVLDAGARVTGCTVHFVDNQYDHGPIILQRQVPVLDDDTPETLAARVFAAECEAYPEAILRVAAGKGLGARD
ncbi:MAG TPA: phosphoribosylglycinamide formyltransferase [Pirellulales bacterium]|jgi:formyltetrahydrofolate-dependent phosphoribosylglycinamide formyltransferase|nr:phosphoribosylglycinamide formyltransferase [Pirellulales bacterium]